MGRRSLGLLAAASLAFVVVAWGVSYLVGLGTLWTVIIVSMVLAIVFGLFARRRREEVVGIGIVLAYFAVAVIATFVLIQAVPYGRGHSNPDSVREPEWSSPRTRELMVNACFGCHSNEVEWPWYSNIAPISWLVTDHVEDGRDAVNYSEFSVRRDDADETVEEILEGSMPPGYYTRFGLHPEANLSDDEVAELVAGLRATPGMSEDDDEDDDD
jgi:hypothetical protein